VIPALVAAALLAYDRRRRDGRWPVGETVARALLSTGACAAAFVAGTPYSLLDRAKFLHDVAGVARHVSVTHGGIDLGIGGVYHLEFSLWYGLGPPLLVAGILGFAWAAVADRRKAAILIAFPLAYYAAIFETRTVFVRYALPFVPFLCISAAALTSALGRSIALIARRLSVRSPAPRFASACLAAIVIAPSAYSVAQIDRLFTATDSRLLAAEWLIANAAPGSSMYLAGSITARPFVEPRPVRFHYWDYQGGSTFFEGTAPVAGLPDFIVIPQTPLPGYTYFPPDLQDLVAHHYDLATVVTAISGDDHLFDRQDAFFYPYAGFQRVSRGGPNFQVYVRRAGDP
jgi:hypothetical protein